jgi:hypothetical protein
MNIIVEEAALKLQYQMIGQKLAVVKIKKTIYRQQAAVAFAWWGTRPSLELCGLNSFYVRTPLFIFGCTFEVCLFLGVIPLSGII